MAGRDCDKFSRLACMEGQNSASSDRCKSRYDILSFFSTGLLNSFYYFYTVVLRRNE